MKYLLTKRHLYTVEQNKDNTLLIKYCGIFPIRDAGLLIANLGGIDAVLGKCKEGSQKDIYDIFIRRKVRR